MTVDPDTRKTITEGIQAVQVDLSLIEKTAIAGKLEEAADLTEALAEVLTQFAHGCRALDTNLKAQQRVREFASAWRGTDDG